MNHDSLLINFQWESKQREILVCATQTNDTECSFPLYQIFRNNKYLFSIYPTINEHACKEWEMIEKDEAAKIPDGFVGILGRMIDAYYLS